MLSTLIWVIGIPLCGIALFLAGWFAKSRIDQIRGQSIEEQAKRILDEANIAGEQQKREKLLEVRDDYLKRKTKLENDYEAKRTSINNLEKKNRDQESSLALHTEKLEKQQRELQQKLHEHQEGKKRSDKELQEQRLQLEKQSTALKTDRLKVDEQLVELAGMSREEATFALRSELLDHVKQESAEMIKDLRDQARMQANREAKEIIVQAIQRCAAEHSTEATVTVVNITNEEIKGRIIGREGRNIRTFESITGVELIIDDTPEAVTLSCFDPIRREIARMALESLVTDGRIHPARIEEVVKRSERELDERIYQLGEQACNEAGVDSIHPELIRNLGKLHYRTSYGQNVLLHSIEVSQLTSLMAVQLGLDAKLASRAGLLHDIGKSIDRNTEGTHTELGVELARRYREPKVVLNAIGSHHDDLESTSLISCLVQAADSISGARPGARRDSLENYIKRLKKLETIANSFNGVSKTFALQAGREIRIMVEHDKVADAQAEQLAHDISSRIQDELEYPGQIKVTVIREFRAVEFAR